MAYRTDRKLKVGGPSNESKLGSPELRSHTFLSRNCLRVHQNSDALSTFVQFPSILGFNFRNGSPITHLLTRKGLASALVSSGPEDALHSIYPSTVHYSIHYSNIRNRNNAKRFTRPHPDFCAFSRVLVCEGHYTTSSYLLYLNRYPKQHTLKTRYRKLHVPTTIQLEFPYTQRFDSTPRGNSDTSIQLFYQRQSLRTEPPRFLVRFHGPQPPGNTWHQKLYKPSNSFPRNLRRTCKRSYWKLLCTVRCVDGLSPYVRSSIAHPTLSEGTKGTEPRIETKTSFSTSGISENGVTTQADQLTQIPIEPCARCGHGVWDSVSPVNFNERN
ncbi:hypothetical protein PM082_023763 [Marasmius tenuissimus]|nr:hypothetical protein PM082_023763 [Marasmius tenuissimus]